MDKEAFSRWLTAYAVAIQNGDWPSCAKLFTEDAVYTNIPMDPPDAAMMSSTREVEARGARTRARN